MRNQYKQIGERISTGVLNFWIPESKEWLAIHCLLPLPLRLLCAACHILKHSIASQLVSANVNMALVKQQLGHKSIGSTMRCVPKSDQQASF